jgi:DNA-directed RNA polymerase specialized sigma24 family protein
MHQPKKNKPSFLKRPGKSGKNQQVWIHWDFATEEEKRVTLERNAAEPHGRTGALVRASDHVTAHESAEELDDATITRLENIVAEAIRKTGRKGLTWDEVAEVTGLDKGSISPRFKPLRHRCRIVFGLELSCDPDGHGLLF